MKIELTKEQYRRFVELVCAGDWLINAWRNERVEEYDEAQDHLYSFYEEFEAGDLIEYDEKMDKYYPTIELEDQVCAYADEYDDDNFWEILIEQMAAKEATEKGLGFEETLDLEDKYRREFQENGIKRLSIDWSKK